ncbi:MAG: F0F1 ATP synthase subunit delta [Candidatus Kerfeldbacteria bacterium]|nr:F0F1 ATP synthase subunit delta [Candidatus Kerfeldbacteria bacterium]
MRLTPKYYAQAWFAALQEQPAAQWSAISGRALQHIYGHGHVKWLPEIVRLMAQLEHSVAGTMSVTIRTAHPIKSELAHQLVNAVLPAAKPMITQQVAAELIGGVQIETEHQRWDASISGQLQRLAHTLTH